MYIVCTYNLKLILDCSALARAHWMDRWIDDCVCVCLFIRVNVFYVYFKRVQCARDRNTFSFTYNINTDVILYIVEKQKTTNTVAMR